MNAMKFHNILDVGCGEGYVSGLISKGKRYIGIDISQTQIKNTRNSTDNRDTHVLIGDACNMHFKDNSFDSAICTDVLEHVLNPDMLFDELQRVVKKNHEMILTFPNERLWQIMRLILFRFPVKSPDHIFSISRGDIERRFLIEKIVNVPMDIRFPALMIVIKVRNVR